MKKVLFVAGAVMLMTFAGLAQARTGCTPALLKHAGRLMQCRTKAHANALRTSTSPTEDLSRCDTTFLARWQSAVRIYDDCPVVDPNAVLASSTSCIDGIVELLAGRTKIIFASSVLYVPDSPGFVYPEGADARCQQLANAVTELQGRTFKALICGSSPDIDGGSVLGIPERFTSSPGPYVDRLGNPIADSLSDLLDGTIDNPITIDETGTPIVIGGGREYAWTGCEGTGGPAQADGRCQIGSYSWTSGHVGTTGIKGRLLETTDGKFINYAIEACNAGLHLICIEQ